MTLLALFALYAVALSAALSAAGHRSDVRPAGGTGRHLVTKALERGYQVKAFVRDPSRLGMEHQRLSIVRGNVLDEAAVMAAVRDIDAVISALGHRRYLWPTSILSRGTANLLAAMKEQGVRRFVFWDKTRQERAIAQSDTDWVIVRPGALTDGVPRGRVTHGFNVGSFLRTVRISRADVAAFMMDQLESDTYTRSAPGVSW